ncbi:type II secretion system minor pseudopilin GspI [Aquabacterium sp. A08]|uniref:type II secretion system minor pseudopilin GspI n=1 Tax=Aquabacterium sp. A08 TaxID=2718532 RepID=UPI00141E3308|nr:type II secretion system minor pseudopilin GspI [Aquabacterium sp. A08]NIC42232.1 type II secretion system minor pseudopilin GspI [Aquabacterium sp. A08]
MSPHRRTERGLTLIEVLVALSILAIGLMAGLQASASLTRLAERQQQQWLAQLCADNALVAVRLQPQPPALGSRSHGCDQGAHRFRVHLHVQPTPNAQFRRLQASVETADTPARVLVDLVTVVGRP